MGKHESVRRDDLLVIHDRLSKSPGHVFYRKRNQLLAEAGFDPWGVALCEPYYAHGKGRPLVPPGVYFRMLLVGYFEGSSQRGMAPGSLHGRGGRRSESEFQLPGRALRRAFKTGGDDLFGSTERSSRLQLPLATGTGYWNLPAVTAFTSYAWACPR